MADLTITAANVVKVTDAANPFKQSVGLAGETITAGQVLCEITDSVTRIKKMWLARNDTAEKANAKGIALCGATAGQPVVYGTKGVLTVGATLTKAVMYCVSNTAGAICPAADIATTGEYITPLYIARTTTEAVLSIAPTGTAV